MRISLGTCLLLGAGILAAAGCSPQEQAAYERYCAEQGIDCAAVVRQWAAAGRPGAGGPEAGAGGPVTAVALKPAEVPAELRRWAEDLPDTGAPASVLFTTGGHTYLVIAGGLQPTGGYRVEVVSVGRQGGAWLIAARVVPPPPGAMVTQALTTPTGFFRLPALTGEVRVQVQAATGGIVSGPDRIWSENFRVAPPRQVHADQILAEGRARVFEASFRVQVWAGGRQIADQQVMADAGAPAYGRFRALIQVPGGVPAGAEVRFVVPSAKDGTLHTELALPVRRPGP